MTSEDYAAFYRKHGYVLVREVFADDEVEQMREAIDGILARVQGTEHDRDHTWRGNHLPENDLHNLQLKGFHDLQYHDAAFTRVVAHPRLVAVLTQLIGPNVQLHHTKMLVKPPEHGAPFPMHQDYPYFPHVRHSVVAASIHLDHTDVENGCLHVIPGSHAWGPLEPSGESKDLAHEFSLDRGTPCPARAGDVLFFNYLTLHGSGVNRSDRVRRNVLAQYRDPADAPLLKDGLEEHVDWGMGLMVAGTNLHFWKRRVRFEIKAAGTASAY